MKYIFRQHPSKLSTLMVSFGAGARAEFNKYPAGMAHFVEHTVFKGTNRYLYKELLWKIASAGGLWNAYTSHDLVTFFVTIPEENLETAFEFLSEIVNNPTFPTNEIEKEKEVVCQEVRMYQDDISRLVSYKLLENIFNTSLAVPVVGFENSVRSITNQHLRSFHSEYFNNNQKLITLCANNNYTNLLQKYFGNADGILTWLPAIKKEYKPSSNSEVFKEGQLQNIIDIAFAGNNLDSIIDDVRSRATFSVFNKIFGSEEVSRLFLKIREDMGLVYGISSGLSNNMDGNCFVIQTQTEPENLNTVIKEIDNEIDHMLTTLPNNEELYTAKNKIKSNEYSKMDSSGDSASIVLQEEFYGRATLNEYLTAVEQVSLEDIKNMSGKVFNNNRYKVVGHG